MSNTNKAYDDHARDLLSELNISSYIKAKKVVEVALRHGLELDCLEENHTQVLFELKHHQWRLFWEETATYTDTYQLRLVQEESVEQEVFYGSFEIRFRLYHDAQVAEVLSANNNKMLKTWYSYPNKEMYLPSEKIQRNRFFNEWLTFCLQHGHCHTRNKTQLAFLN